LLVEFSPAMKPPAWKKSFVLSERGRYANKAAPSRLTSFSMMSKSLP
jgi:hypothetical protein